MGKVGLQQELKYCGIAATETFAAENGIVLHLHNPTLILHFISL